MITDDIHSGIEASYTSDLNELYWTREDAIVETDDIIGKCTVKCIKVIISCRILMSDYLTQS